MDCQTIQLASKTSAEERALTEMQRVISRHRMVLPYWRNKNHFKLVKCVYLHYSRKQSSGK